jgi:hypothetical protein
MGARWNSAESREESSSACQSETSGHSHALLHPGSTGFKFYCAILRVNARVFFITDRESPTFEIDQRFLITVAVRVLYDQLLYNVVLWLPHPAPKPIADVLGY